jgi:hypothetical protein
MSGPTRSRLADSGALGTPGSLTFRSVSQQNASVNLPSMSVKLISSDYFAQI